MWRTCGYLHFQILPSMEDFSPNALEVMWRAILQKKVQTTPKGQQEIWHTRLKGQSPKKAK